MLWDSAFWILRWIDIIDIFLVALLMFQVYRWTRGTNALRIVVGILFIYLFWIVTRVLKMELMSMILGQIIGVGVTRVDCGVPTGDPPIFLILLGTQYTNRRVSFLARLFRPKRSAPNVAGVEWIDTVVSACEDMASTKTGALIVIARKVNLRPFIEQGERIDALISAPLLKNIFFKNSPLHDGAVVIAGSRIACGQVCITLDRKRGADGVRYASPCGNGSFGNYGCVWSSSVSEERGTISLARKGHVSPRYFTGQIAQYVA